ncbi:sodium-dependent proline transporter-like isoform X2 [Dermacentor albipictus]|uniref:sodium-dependent proline transporter-like isoform X2 n=1 Tax=Dermacentor albipictus TaxID=60249 RepID=UPI0038FD3BF8
MEERDQWGSKCTFLLSLIGMSVGMGNVWRFPYVVYDNGGGAFIIPYITLTMIAGRPMYLLELILGQFSGYAQTKAFDGYPIAKGVGWAMVYASVSLAVFNSMVLAYVIIFLYYSLGGTTTLPWTQCDPSWADEQCYVKEEGVFSCKAVEQMALNKYKPEWLSKLTAQSLARLHDGNDTSNDTVFEGRRFASNCINATQISSYHFFYKKVLGFSPHSRDQGSYQAHLLLAVALGWCCVFACVHDGIRSLGKVIYITTTLPFGLLLIILARVLTLPGASVGLKFFIVPKWSEVLSVTLWRRAAEQVILSLGLGYGTVICYAGFGRLRNKLRNDLEVVIATQFFASFGFGLVVFSVLGFLASNQHIHIEDIITSGFDMAFVAYPEAVSHFRNAPLWVVCFYVALFCMALNAQCATVQAVLSPMRDEFSPTLRPRRWVMAATGCLALMFCGLPITRHDGIFTMKMINGYFGDLLLPTLALLEMCVIVHGYGLIRFCHDVCFMLKKWPPFELRFSWKYTCPAVLLGLCITNAVFFEKLKIAGHDLPVWGTCVGVTLVFIGLAIVVAFCVYHLYVFEWDYDAAMKFSDDWGPRDPDERLRYHAYLKSQNIEAVVTLNEDATDGPIQGQSSGEEGESHSGDQRPSDVVVGAEETPPDAAAAPSDTSAMPTAPGAQLEAEAQRSGADRSERRQQGGPGRKLVVSKSGVSFVATPLSDGEEKPPEAGSS